MEIKKGRLKHTKRNNGNKKEAKIQGKFLIIKIQKNIFR